jgi:hypothetical protein
MTFLYIVIFVCGMLPFRMVRWQMKMITCLMAIEWLKEME